MKYATTVRTCLLWILVQVLCNSKAQGLSCYQCDSSVDFRCSEYLTSRDLHPQPCVGLSEPRYCVKITGIFGVEGIRCFQCNSIDDLTCGEFFNSQTSTTRLEECEGLSESHYCIKTTGIFNGQLGTKRFCSERFLDNYCDYVKRPGDGREYRSCVYTCTGDGCNSGSGLTAFKVLTFVIAGPLVAFFKCMM